MSSVRNSAFTLLEVVMAVAIIALVALTIYPFLEVNLLAISQTTARGREDRAMQSLVALLQEQLNHLPKDGGALLGAAHKFKDKSSDELQWTTRAGNGLLTRNATGSFTATLALKPAEKTTPPVLGLRRVAEGEKEDKTNWLPLIENITAVELRYFDPRLNAWVEKWSDPQMRPSLIRARFWRGDNPDAFETVLSLPPIGAGGRGGVTLD